MSRNYSTHGCVHNDAAAKTASILTWLRCTARGVCSAASVERQRSQGLEAALPQGRLQVSPEPEVMSPPSSPRLRHSTFGATLDFIEALCDASSGLTAFAAVRQRGLGRCSLATFPITAADAVDLWLSIVVIEHSLRDYRLCARFCSKHLAAGALVQ